MMNAHSDADPNKSEVSDHGRSTAFQKIDLADLDIETFRKFLRFVKFLPYGAIDTIPDSLQGERILSARQGAEILGVSVATFRRLHWAGKLPPAIQLSARRVGWRTRDLLATLATGETAA